jgi:DNA-binding transcriptional MerR regulator
VRISELAERTDVPVHTLKYYLREGLLMPGRATGRTRAEYGEEHVERVRLVRALVEHGHVPIASVRAVVGALDSPPPHTHDLLGVAHCALPAPPTSGEVSAEVAELVASLGWDVGEGAPALANLSDAVSVARANGVPLEPAHLRTYAEAMRRVADLDVDVALAAQSPADAMRMVVVGTVLVDPVLVALRRLAQEASSAQRSPAADRQPG